jgi:crotonobetainyl-CoA:carnitine CoA-transferase CaiB-like acyl-CoA transferase
MREVRSDIIMASLQAFGQTGPRRDYVSFGPILMSYSGHGISMARSGDRPSGCGMPDSISGLCRTVFRRSGILAALHYRARTGKGQYIDISQAETAASMLDRLTWNISSMVASPSPRQFQRRRSATRRLSLQR